MRARFQPLRAPFAVAVSGLLLLSACAATQSSGSAGEPSVAADEPNELLVLEWSGYEAPDFWIDFENANPDIEVTFEIGASDADILAKMKAGSQADIFHPYTGWLQFYVDEGLVAGDRHQQADELGQGAGASSRSSVSSTASSTSSRGTGASPRSSTAPTRSPRSTSWDALFDPDYSGHISMWDDGPGAVTVSSYIHGWDETAITDEQLAQIEADWIAQQPLNLFYWSGETRARGPCRTATSGSPTPGRALRHAARRTECRSPTPTPRRVATPGSACTASARADNLDLAHAFLDGKLAETSAATW